MRLEFPVESTVRVCTLNLLFINIFHDIVVCIESRRMIKAKHVLSICWLFRFCAEKNCTHTEALVQFSPRKIERINRPTRHVLLQSSTVVGNPSLTCFGNSVYYTHAPMSSQWMKNYSPSVITRASLPSAGQVFVSSILRAYDLFRKFVSHCPSTHNLAHNLTFISLIWHFGN